MARAVTGHVTMLRRRIRPLCRDLEPDCFALVFCDALRCAVDLRRGLTGELDHCPICGIDAVAHYPESRARPRPGRTS
ncbi:MAG: hypothetical protein WD981_02760 [Gaiellaceae bacterium]